MFADASSLRRLRSAARLCGSLSRLCVCRRPPYAYLNLRTAAAHSFDTPLLGSHGYLAFMVLCLRCSGCRCFVRLGWTRPRCPRESSSEARSREPQGHRKRLGCRSTCRLIWCAAAGPLLAARRVVCFLCHLPLLIWSWEVRAGALLSPAHLERRQRCTASSACIGGSQVACF